MELVKQPPARPAPFDELAGRVEGVARAVLELAQMLDAQADVDGLTLAARWRRGVAPHATAPGLATARRTLQEMASELEQMRFSRAKRAAARCSEEGLRLIRRPGGRAAAPARA